MRGVYSQCRRIKSAERVKDEARVVGGLLGECSEAHFGLSKSGTKKRMTLRLQAAAPALGGSLFPC